MAKGSEKTIMRERTTKSVFSARIAFVSLILYIWLCVMRGEAIYIEQIGIYIMWKHMALCMLIFSLINWAMSSVFPCRRSLADSMIYSAFPVAVHTLIYNLQYYFIIGLISGAAVISIAVYCAFKISKRASKHRVGRVLNSFRYNFVAAALIPIIASVFFDAFSTKAIYSRLPDYADTEQKTSMESMITDEIEDLRCLTDGRWDHMSDKDKLDVLQKVINIEAAYFGCSSTTIIADVMDDELNADYSVKEKKIYLSYRVLSQESSKTCVRSAIHELTHHYQKEAVDSIEFTDNEKAQELTVIDMLYQWKENFDSYHDFREGLWIYADQPLESYAVWYAGQETDRILEIIGQQTE